MVGINKDYVRFLVQSIPAYRVSKILTINNDNKEPYGSFVIEAYPTACSEVDLDGINKKRGSCFEQYIR